MRLRVVLVMALLAFVAKARAAEPAMAFFGDVMTQSLGLVGKIVAVDCH